MAILLDETPHMQQVSIDEAFLDVTPTAVNRMHPVIVAQRIQERVAQLGVTCSIGVGSTKSIAKLASDMDKPRGLTVVLPGSELNFIDPLPVRRLSGVGGATERKLKDHGIVTLGDLYRANDDEIVGMLGKTGRMLLDRVRCLEDDPIDPDDTVKSVSNETSFATNLTARDDIEAQIAIMAAKVGRRLRRKGLFGRTLSLKVRYADLRSRSCQVQLEHPSQDEYTFMEHLPSMLDELWQPGMALRLVGVGIAGFEDPDEPAQLTLFDDADEAQSTVSAAQASLLEAADRVKERFGESSLMFGRELRFGNMTTGSSSKTPADYK